MMTVAERFRNKRGQMTRSELQLGNAILDDYPMSGLCSITELAAKADVSTPTVGRMLQKLGFSGYAEFQAALREELSEMISNPITKRAHWKSTLPEEHILSQYSRQALANQQAMLDDLDADAFDGFCRLLADPRRRIYVAGGRITGTIAQFLYLHLQMIRADVNLIPATVAWPHDLLDVREGDVLIAFDVRRYENTTLTMAQMCHEEKAEVVLFTDQWISPIQRHARHIFAARISVPSAWDSMGSLLLLSECTIAAVQQMLWDSVQARTDMLEAAFDRTKLFRKFV
ncbi:MAG: MurR/RpiR family transcriptional regulator [Rhodospirillales bacterium]|nr:MurR/RpiR family transcriptional regulator [Rhodospirillales bacterium]